MKNDARKMALENQIELAQQNAIDFTHACMTIALHDVFGVGKDRLDKVTQRKDEINGELMRRMAIPAKNQKAQLNEAEKWLVGLLPEGVVSVFRVPVIKGVPRKRREVQLKMAIDRAATLEWRGYATACAQVLGFGPRRLEKTAAGNNCEFWPAERVGGNRRRGCGHGNAVPLRPGRLQDRGRSAGCAGRGCIGKNSGGKRRRRYVSCKCRRYSGK